MSDEVRTFLPSLILTPFCNLLMCCPETLYISPLLGEGPGVRLWAFALTRLTYILANFDKQEYKLTLLYVMFKSFCLCQRQTI